MHRAWTSEESLGRAPLAIQATSARRICPETAAILSQTCARERHGLRWVDFLVEPQSYCSRPFEIAGGRDAAVRSAPIPRTKRKNRSRIAGLDRKSVV